MLNQFLSGEVKVEAVHRKLKYRDEALKQIKYLLQRAQECMKNKADRRRADQVFEVGDWVFLKIRPHGQVTVGARINPKLSPRNYGPF
jgi:hypothetical protein